MTATLAASEWIGFIEREHLAEILPAGGAAVRFAVRLDGASGGSLEEPLAAASRRRGFLLATVSSADTRVHMIEEIFFRIADQVPWQRLSRSVMEQLALAEGLRLRTAEGAGAGGALLSELAAVNQQDPDLLRGDLRRRLTRQVLRDPLLAREFRVAMSQLCLAELTGGGEAETTRAVMLDWLTGRNRRVSAVKPYQINSRIHRGNARHLLESLFRWVRRAGLPGTVVLIDIERLTLRRNPRDGLIFYTRAAGLDAYEVLRQLIDTNDRLESALLVVTAESGFLALEETARGLGGYEALKLRIYDEVRDRRLANPMNPLVRLTATGGPATP